MAHNEFSFSLAFRMRYPEVVQQKAVFNASESNESTQAANQTAHLLAGTRLDLV